MRSALRGPCMRSLQMPCFRSACNESSCGSSWRSLVSRSCTVRSAGPFMTILWGSLRGPGMEILLSRSVFYKSSCEDLVEILVKWCQRPLHDLVQVFVRSSGPLCVLAWSGKGCCEKTLCRFCSNPPREVLALWSWRSSALVLVWKFFWDAHRKLLYEDLVSSSI